VSTAKALFVSVVISSLRRAAKPHGYAFGHRGLLGYRMFFGPNAQRKAARDLRRNP
jgi:hypothetical protein